MSINYLIFRNVDINLYISLVSSTLSGFIQGVKILTDTSKLYINQLTLKCTTPTPVVLNASPDVTTPKPDRQSLWLDLININDYAKFHKKKINK